MILIVQFNWQWNPDIVEWLVVAHETHKLQIFFGKAKK